MICEICGKECKLISTHIIKSHKDISVKEYYDRYLGNPKLCEECGNTTEFISIALGYKKYCSLHCARVHGAKIVKEKYGYTPGGYGSVEFSNYMEKTYGAKNCQQVKEIREKSKQTTKNHLGVDYAFLTPEAKEKAKIASHSEEVKQKIIQTSLEKYGVDNPLKSDVVKQKSKQSIFTNYAISTSKDRFERSIINLNNAGTKDEKYFYDNISKNYKVLYNVISDNYPYLCDFYIFDLDLYIELNLTWTHGWHYFDETNLDDVNKLQEMKSKHNDYYDNAIDVWTKKDIEKRDCAIKNNLNFVVIWNKDQIKKFLELLESNYTFTGFIDFNYM